MHRLAFFPYSFTVCVATTTGAAKYPGYYCNGLSDHSCKAVLPGRDARVLHLGFFIHTSSWLLCRGGLPGRVLGDLFTSGTADKCGCSHAGACMPCKAVCGVVVCLRGVFGVEVHVAALPPFGAAGICCPRVASRLWMIGVPAGCH
jgi:hypothetical protein